jgi:hypothetical protein
MIWILVACHSKRRRRFIAGY